METAFKRLLPLLLLLTLPAVVLAQFDYTDNGDRTCTITRYTGSSGDVTIPSAIDGLSVTSIGDESFSSCSSLTNITIPNTVTSIGYAAFSSCSSLTSVTIPDSVTSIGDLAFDNCLGLASVKIGSGVTNIGNRPFVMCDSLTEITVDALNPAYSSVAGVLFNKNQTTLIECMGGKAGDYTIPDSVTSIGIDAFDDCFNLTSVTIPNSVTSIGDGAFEFCSSLTSVTIGNSVTNIGDWTFWYCESLTSVTIPDSVNSIGYAAFSSCSSLTNVAIGNRVTSIGNSAFESCSSLTSVTIPNGVISIGYGAFYYCTSLTSITIPNSVTSIGQSAFSGCTNLSEVYFLGNAPSAYGSVFWGDNNATVYYLAGTTGWGDTYCDRPTALWNLPVADASATAAWLVSANGANATAVLNGTHSYNLGGNALQYLWFSSPPAQPPTLLATGVVAVIVLPVGSHPITLVVSDTLAASTNSVIVSVLTTSQAVQRLISLVNGSAVPNPKPLTATLSAALASIERSNLVAAANQLRAFENKVQAQVNDPTLARQFIQAAQQIIEALGSSGPGHSEQVRLLAHPGAKGRFSFTGTAGRLHVIEASTNLLDWERIGVAVDDGDGTFTVEDANAVRFPNRFYRVVSP